MNTCINLLPWRAERRQRRWRKSLWALALSVLAGGAAWCWLDAAVDVRLHAQYQHNQALAQQLAELDARIEAFEHHVQQQRIHTIARTRLERERWHFVHLLDILARHTPVGVVLSEVSQQDNTLNLIGHASTSAQIARTVQQWDTLTAATPILSAISADKQGGAGYTFTLSLPWPIVDENAQMQLARMETGR